MSIAGKGFNHYSCKSLLRYILLLHSVKEYFPLYASYAMYSFPQILIEMDRQDEQNGKMKEIHQKLTTSYTQFKSKSRTLGDPMPPNNTCRLEDLEINPGSNF